MPRRRYLFVLVLALTYVGPYLYTYWRAQNDVFPRAIQIDNTATNNLMVHVDKTVSSFMITEVTSNSSGKTASWSVASYRVQYGILNRIFSNYRKVPVLLDVTKVTFSAIGIFNGTVILQCSNYRDRLIIPTGAEFLPIYKSILFANNNTFATSACTGAGPPSFDFAKLSQQYSGVLPIMFSWTISATVTGELVTTQKTWQGVYQATIVP